MTPQSTLDSLSGQARTASRVRAASSARYRGFTLVELLVVVSIIALLISILLPSLRNAREQAKMTKCLAHMRGIGQASMTFAAEYNNRMQLVSSEPGVQAIDSGRQMYAYAGNRELLAWPVALARASGIRYSNNWDWGVRAAQFAGAIAKVDRVSEEYEAMLCPSDRVRLSSPFYPRNEGPDNGLFGTGDPNDPTPPSQENLAYWGRLSFGINEDIAGTDGTVGECWRSVPSGTGTYVECQGGASFAPFHPCARSGEGHRLRGNLDRVFDPGTVGLVFETGPESEKQYLRMAPTDEFANLVISKEAQGPYLGDAQQRYVSRIPNNRHPDGRLNVLYADTHGGTVRPVRYVGTDNNGKKLPAEYGPRVRVSPYRPRQNP